MWSIVDEWLSNRSNWVNKEIREISPMTWVEGLPSHLFKSNTSQRSTKRMVQKYWMQRTYLESKEKSIAGHILKEMSRELKKKENKVCAI